MSTPYLDIEWQACEQASLEADGSIVIVRWFRASPNQKSRTLFKPGDADYEYYRQRHQISDDEVVSSILQGWSGDKWVDLYVEVSKLVRCNEHSVPITVTNGNPWVGRLA